MSWESLDRTREEYRRRVEADEEELAAVLARLMRDKKILKQAEERAKQKALHLEAEMEATGELEASEDCPAADAHIGLSPAVWSSLDFVNSAIDFSGLSSGGTVIAGPSNG